jgi:hypothetical protein
MSPQLAHRMFLLWIAALATGFLLLLARPAHGVGLAWNAFAGTPGSSNEIDLACTTGGFHELVVDFEVPQTFVDVNLLEVTIALGGIQYPNEPPLPPLAPFWHFEPGGCDENGSQVSLEMPADPAGRENPWGFYSSAATAYLSYAPDSPSAGRGRFVVQIVRSSPTTLVPGQRYFAFRLILNTCDADACDGCDLPGAVVVTSAVVGGPSQQPYALNPFDSGDNPFVCMNGESCGITAAANPISPIETSTGSVSEVHLQPIRHVENLCAPTPARARTWGSVKTQYR